ncbi:uncharacterized protein CELE_F37H8.6 [Caenorhabditis elegans]|uniref:Uncharacterized protein n=1 Tax=Caenorhabditis elegans TaxID=6239 RepID=D3KFW0_CAEEL|nr:Uncharacterized protein CELE_F37H8.6 [Caenorhabditis elegans]CBJ25071.1 Uncharacterized protein CELE_F37H8.6 [Caenorhabditis elegans]|eukprot:NP_001254293.1 Uncharacterized protein CELE_F37H8.6 [Caenorhabditis elegans]
MVGIIGFRQVLNKSRGK